jgi:hypothetical protein
VRYLLTWLTRRPDPSAQALPLYISPGLATQTCSGDGMPVGGLSVTQPYSRNGASDLEIEQRRGVGY